MRKGEQRMIQKEIRSGISTTTLKSPLVGDFLPGSSTCWSRLQDYGTDEEESMMIGLAGKYRQLGETNFPARQDKRTKEISQSTA